MALSSVDITKKRLILRGAKLPPPEVRPEPVILVPVEKPASEEEIAYSKLMSINPVLADLVECFGLISADTGEPVKKVDVPGPGPMTDREPELVQTDSDKLRSLAQRVVHEECSYTQEEIIKRLQEATNVNHDRAAKGFALMVQAGHIEQTPGGKYYLSGSTPF